MWKNNSRERQTWYTCGLAVSCVTVGAVVLLFSSPLPLLLLESCALLALNKICPSASTAWSRMLGVNHISVKMCTQQSLISCCWVALLPLYSPAIRHQPEEGLIKEPLGPSRVSLALMALLSSLPGVFAALSAIFFFLAGLAGRSADAAGADPLTVCCTQSKPHTFLMLMSASLS